MSAVPAKKKKSKSKAWIVLFIILLMAGGGGFWFFSPWGQKTLPQLSNLENLDDGLLVGGGNTQEGQQTQTNDSQSQNIIETEPAATEQEEPEGVYYIQVATCFYNPCKNNTKRILHRRGFPTTQRLNRQIGIYYQLRSTQKYARKKGNSIIQRIYENSAVAGTVRLVGKKEQYQIVIGNFIDKKQTQDLKRQFDTLYSRNTLLFQVIKIKRSFNTTKVYAGPFETMDTAQNALKEIRTNRELSSAFITTEI